MPAVVAYPDHRAGVQVIRPVDRVAHRPAGVQVHDYVAEAGVQAQDREPDPVEFGKRDVRRSRPGVPAVGVRQRVNPRFGRAVR